LFSFEILRFQRLQLFGERLVFSVQLLAFGGIFETVDVGEAGLALGDCNLRVGDLLLQLRQRQVAKGTQIRVVFFFSLGRSSDFSVGLVFDLVADFCSDCALNSSCRATHREYVPSKSRRSGGGVREGVQ